MHAGRLRRIAAKAIMAVAVAAVGLMGPSPVARADQERPINVFAISNQTPSMVSVYWDYYGDDHYWFVIEDPSSGLSTTADRDKRGMSLFGLQPSTTYNLHVCAVYYWNRVCSSEDGGGYATVTTPSAQTPPPPPPPPPPAEKPIPTLARATNLRVTPLTATTASVTWQTGPWPEDDAFEYSLGIRCTDQATGEACHSTITDRPIAFPLQLSATSFRLTRLQAGHRYAIGVCKTVTYPTNVGQTQRPYCADVTFDMPAYRADERSRCVETGTCEIPPAAETRVQGCQLTGSCAAPTPAPTVQPPAAPAAPAAETRHQGCQLTGTCPTPAPVPTVQPPAPTVQPPAVPAPPPAATRSGRGCQLTGTC